jgi:hypothetical protein
MRCTRCQESMARRWSYESSDDNGRLWVVAWRCGMCGILEEEILTCSKSGLGEPQRVRYAVQPLAVA